jgi:hypothetical protein
MTHATTAPARKACPTNVNEHGRLPPVPAGLRHIAIARLELYRVVLLAPITRAHSA